MARRGEMNDETDGDIKNNAGKENSSTTESDFRNAFCGSDCGSNCGSNSGSKIQIINKQNKQNTYG